MPVHARAHGGANGDPAHDPLAAGGIGDFPVDRYAHLPWTWPSCVDAPRLHAVLGLGAPGSLLQLRQRFRTHHRLAADAGLRLPRARLAN